MLLAHEYTQFATTRKALRVSNPTGHQRSTYFLQVPFRYSLPLMAGMSVLHWLVSRSIFLVQISVEDVGGTVQQGKISGCGYSPMAIVLALCLGGMIVLALVGLSARKLDRCMPIAGSCSLAIAAACSHPDEDDPATLPLMYGVMGECKLGEHERLHVGFSSKEVARLVDGVVYT